MFNNISHDISIPRFVEREKIYGEMYKDVDKKLYCKEMEIPITVKQETATMNDIAIHGITQQYLSHTTVSKHIRYLNFMANYENFPVHLRPPDKNNFLMHIRYRLFYENPPAGCSHVCRPPGYPRPATRRSSSNSLRKYAFPLRWRSRDRRTRFRVR